MNLWFCVGLPEACGPQAGYPAWLSSSVISIFLVFHSTSAMLSPHNYVLHFSPNVLWSEDFGEYALSLNPLAPENGRLLRSRCFVVYLVLIRLLSLRADKESYHCCIGHLFLRNEKSWGVVHCPNWLQTESQPFPRQTKYMKSSSWCSSCWKLSWNPQLKILFLVMESPFNCYVKF